MRQHFQRVDRHQWQLTTEHIGDGRRAALVRHMRQLDTSSARKQFDAEMRRRSVTWGGEVHETGFRFGNLDHFAETSHTALRVGRDHHGHTAHERYRYQIALRIEWCRLIQRHVRGQRVSGKQQRVAIGHSINHRAHCDIGARTRLVFDHHRLPQTARHALAHGACNDVYGTTSRIANYDLDRLRRIRLRRCGGSEQGDHTDKRSSDSLREFTLHDD